MSSSEAHAESWLTFACPGVDAVRKTDSASFVIIEKSAFY